LAGGAPKPIVIKNDMLLRLFFYRQLPREKVLSITAAHIEQLKAFKLELDEIEATEGSWADKFQYDTLRWGKDFYDFQIIGMKSFYINWRMKRANRLTVLI
jgi:hypothetical protein